MSVSPTPSSSPQDPENRVRGPVADSQLKEAALSSGPEFRDAALAKPIAALIGQLGGLLAESQRGDYKTPILDALVKEETPPGILQASEVRAAFKDAFLQLVDAHKIGDAQKLFKKFHPQDPESSEIIKQALDIEFAKPEFGFASVVASHFPIEPIEVRNRFAAAANRMIAEGNVIEANTSLDHAHTYLRHSKCLPDVIAITPENLPEFKRQYIALLEQGSDRALSGNFVLGDLLKDPEVRLSMVKGLAAVLSSETSYRHHHWRRFFSFSAAELQDQAVQTGVLAAIKHECHDQNPDIEQYKTAFKPPAAAVENAVIEGFSSLFKEHPYSTYAAARAADTIQALNCSDIVLKSEACQEIGVHSLVAHYCYFHRTNCESQLPYDFDEIAQRTYKLTPESQEKAKLIAAGRIYGLQIQDAYEASTRLELPDSVLLDRTESGKLRFFPQYLRKLVELYDIKAFRELEHFRSENSPLLHDLALPSGTPLTQTAADVEASNKLHLTPYQTEALAKAKADLPALAANKDFKQLWEELQKVDGARVDPELFEAGAALFGYDQMFRYLQARLRHEPYEGLGRFAETLGLAEVSGLTPDVFFERIIEPQIAPVPRRWESGHGTHPLEFFNRTVLHTANLPKILDQYPSGNIPPHIKMTTDRIVAEYPDIGSIFASWNNFVGFVARYHKAFDGLHYGEDRPYVNPPMANISIYEANGIKPEDVRC